MDHIDDRFYITKFGDDCRLHDANRNACYWIRGRFIRSMVNHYCSQLQKIQWEENFKGFFRYQAKDQQLFMGPCLLVIRFLLSRL